MQGGPSGPFCTTSMQGCDPRVVAKELAATSSEGSLILTLITSTHLKLSKSGEIPVTPLIFSVDARK